MDYSARIKKEAKHYKVRPDWLVMADLRSIGYTDAEAYNIVHSDVYAFGDSRVTSMRDDIVKTAEFKSLVSDRVHLLQSGKINVMQSDIDLITPEQVAKEILRSAMSLPEGSKERGDMLVKYEEVLRKNQDVDTQKDDDGGVGIYLPLKCYQCVLLQAYVEKKKREAQKPPSDTTEQQGSDE